MSENKDVGQLMKPITVKIDANEALDRLERIIANRSIVIKVDAEATLVKLEGKALQVAFWGGVATGAVGTTLVVMLLCVVFLSWGKKQ